MDSISFKAQPGKQKTSGICKKDDLIQGIGYTNVFESWKREKDAEVSNIINCRKRVLLLWLEERRGKDRATRLLELKRGPPTKQRCQPLRRTPRQYIKRSQSVTVLYLWREVTGLGNGNSVTLSFIQLSSFL